MTSPRKPVHRFLQPGAGNIGGYSTYVPGYRAWSSADFDCERMPNTAVELGVATSTTLVDSSDQQQIRQTILPTPPPSGYAAIMDDTKLPGIGEAGRDLYRRFLAAPSPRAFAIAHRAGYRPGVHRSSPTPRRRR